MRKVLVFTAGVLLFLGCKKTENNDNPQLSSSSLELVFKDSIYQLTGVAVSKTGRLFTNYPLWSPVYKYAVVEIHQNNTVTPYPNTAMNSWKEGDNGMLKWVCVQAVYVDDADNLWVVDPASPMQAGVYQNSYKLVKINLSTNTPEQIYNFAGVADNQSYINDVRVDSAGKYAYLTNSNEGGILVVNLATSKIRQVLQGHYSVTSDHGYTLTINGKEVKRKGVPFKVNSDGIALSPDNQYLYYKPLSDNKLYRIKTEYLKNDTMTTPQLAAKVEDLGRFTVSDGMIFDKKGNLYLGDMENYRIMKITPDLKMSVLVKDDRLIWPDSYQVSKDGYLYISCSQIQKQPDFNEGINKRTSAYTIYRVKLPE